MKVAKVQHKPLAHVMRDYTRSMKRQGLSDTEVIEQLMNLSHRFIMDNLDTEQPINLAIVPDNLDK